MQPKKGLKSMHKAHKNPIPQCCALDNAYIISWRKSVVILKNQGEHAISHNQIIQRLEWRE